MSKFSPLSDVAKLDNWRTTPYSKWSFHHVWEIVPSAEIKNNNQVIIPLSENIKNTAKIAKLTKSYNVSLEGEVGIVGFHKGNISEGTNLIEAKNFANESGVDAMAISVGNTHLQINKIAKIDINKIINIQNTTNIPLVLHGSSGITYRMRRKIASNTNVAKFNIGTELRIVAGNSLRENINSNRKIFDRLELIKPTIIKIKNQTKKIIKNIGYTNE